MGNQVTVGMKYYAVLKCCVGPVLEINLFKTTFGN